MIHVQPTVAATLANLAACFDYTVPLRENMTRFMERLRAAVSLGAMVVVRMEQGGKPPDVLCLGEEPFLSPPALRTRLPLVFENRFGQLRQAGILPYAAVAALLPGAPAGLDVFVVPFRRDGELHGLALFTNASEHAPWDDAKTALLHQAAAVLHIFLDGKTHCEAQEFHNTIFTTVMDRLNVSLYITNPYTDEILYMNQEMKKVFGLEKPEGLVCWQVLQAGKTQRCEFCPVGSLLQQPDQHAVYHWEEHNSRTGRIYENHDSLMPWFDGSLAHLQQSIDITDSKRQSEEASLDELTAFPNRRAGLERLAQSLETVKTGETSFVAALFDVNNLKIINDAYGHAKGDVFLRLTAQTVRTFLRSPDYCFRLSGDEFVAVLHSTDRYAAVQLMEQVLAELEKSGEDMNLPYRPGFCFGCLEVCPDHELSVADVLEKADGLMYEQKKMFHIREAERRLAEQTGTPVPRSRLDFNASDLYKALAQSTDSYAFVSDVTSGVFHYSRAMVEEFGLPGEYVENAVAVWGSRIHPDDKPAFLEANQIVIDGRTNAHCVEYRARNRNDEWVWVRCRGCLKRDEQGNPVLFAGFITNLGQKNKIDHNTGLFNKIQLADDVAATLRDRPSRPLSLMLLGLDDFKRINELYNRAFGDEVLRITGQKIQEMLPPEATVYRLDGDEFGILAHGGSDTVRSVYRSLHERFRSQQEYDGKKYFCTLSAGAATYPDDATTYADLFQCAECALEASKNGGKNRLAFFHHDLLHNQKRSLELIELLRESMERRYEGFSLVYQPQVTADGRRVVGAEALVRWNCAKYGFVSPGEFVPLLEQSGLIVPVGKWIFRQAARQCKDWTKIRPDFVLSINLSYLQVIAENMIPFIRTTLENLELNPANLLVEFTESCMTRENDQIRNIFGEIRAMGIRIAMDDFGTGYSSLGMLKNSPADVVKIDRIFVRDILHSRFDATFIRFVVALCHDAGIKVCLEGVERNEELELVRPMHLDYIQGYLFGRPVGVDVFARDYLSRDGG